MYWLEHMSDGTLHPNETRALQTSTIVSVEVVLMTIPSSYVGFRFNSDPTF